MKDIVLMMIFTMIGLLIPFDSFSQKDGSATFYDFELDYYPQIQAIRVDTSSSFRIKMDGEFQEVLSRIVSVNLSNDVITKRFSGRTMSSSGIYPIALKECLMWLSIEIGEEGQVIDLSVHGASSNGDDHFSDKMGMLFADAQIKPALIDGKAVKCKLFYTIQSAVLARR